MAATDTSAGWAAVTNLGINLGHHETVDDWNAVRADGITFASITTTESMNWRDPVAGEQVVTARKAGLHCGVRHLARPGGPGEQAELAARFASPLGALSAGSLAPALHVGVEGIDDKFVKAWIKTIRQVAGIQRVLIHAEYENWLHHLHPDKWADAEVVLWLARHNGIPGRPGWFHSRLGLHQHSTGRDAVVYPFTLTDLLLQ